MSGSVRQCGIVAIFAVCLAAPVLEMFDRWDQPLQTGNDTEANLVVVALCVGVAFVAARAFLKRIGAAQPVQSIRIERLDHNTPAGDFALLLEPVLAGRDAGLLSEAGLPAIADPGAGLVRLAHERGVRVVPLSGPSSIVLALSASGLEGQRFAFHGYLPVAPAELASALKDLERQSRRPGAGR